MSSGQPAEKLIVPSGERAAVESDGQHVVLTGDWVALRLDRAERHLRYVRPFAGEATVDLTGITRIDSAGAWLLHRALYKWRANGVEVELIGLDDFTRDLLEMISGEGIEPGRIMRPPEQGFLETLGRDSASTITKYLGFVAFIGRITFAALRIFLTPARLRWSQVVDDIEEGGFDALPIVGLLAFLMGIVIAYQGAVVLVQYGAGIFIADLVGLAMLRELAPLVTAIIVAGRTGSAYTAQIGTMVVTEEVDALRTMGITPVDLLVLPKLFALVIVLPLLTVFADLMGLLGGMVMAGGLLEVSYQSFIERLGQSIEIKDYLVGIGKAPVFAAIIASVGCYQGFQVSGSAESVGKHTTMSVVQAIFLVIVVDALFSIIFSKLGI